MPDQKDSDQVPADSGGTNGTSGVAIGQTEPNGTFAGDPSGISAEAAAPAPPRGIYIPLKFPPFVTRLWTIRRRRYASFVIMLALAILAGGFLVVRHIRQDEAHAALVRRTVTAQQRDDLGAISSDLGGFLHSYGVEVISKSTTIKQLPVGSAGWWSPTSLVITAVTPPGGKTKQMQVALPANAVLTNAPSGVTSLFVSRLPTTDAVGTYDAFAFRICDIVRQPVSQNGAPSNAIAARYVLFNAIVSGCASDG